jgi:thioredoxin reductase (NADPH)
VADSRNPLLVAALVNPTLAGALQADMERVYGPRGFDAAGVSRGHEAIALLEGARREGRPVAALIIDQDLAPVPAREVISRARHLHNEVRVVLLIEHQGMKRALAAMDEGAIDYFFIKPLAAHDEQLFPVLTDMLEVWMREVEGASRIVRVVGNRAQLTHPVCEFLARNDITYHFHPLDGDDYAQLLLGGAPADDERLPLVVLPDGRRLWNPSVAGVAGALGLRTSPSHDEYDLVVIGAGPAGLAAAVYGASEGLRTILIERASPGGQAGQSSRIENYLGFPSGLRGRELAQRALVQAHRFEAEIVRPCEATKIICVGGRQTVELSGGERLAAASTLIACGVDYRRLQHPSLERLTGRGIFYGAGVTDARDHEGERVIVVGGANSAGQAALHFAERAEQVIVAARCVSLRERMSEYLVERIERHERIDVRTETVIAEAHGEERLEAISLSDSPSGSTEKVDANALFAFIGAEPRTAWLDDTIDRDERGFILTGRDLSTNGPRAEGQDPLPLETSRAGVFAAGDVRFGSIKRVAAAVGEGSMAVQLIHQHLAK